MGKESLRGVRAYASGKVPLPVDAKPPEAIYPFLGAFCNES